MQDSRLRAGALAGFGVVCLLTAAAALLARGITRHPDLAGGELGYDVGFAVVGSALAVTAVVLCWLRPRNSVGWLLGVAALAGAACNAGQVYGARALVRPESGLPLGELALSCSAPLWVVSLLLPATVVLGRYPSGQSAGAWGRRVERATVVLMGVFWIGYAGSPFSVADEVPAAQPPVLLPELARGLLLAVGGLGLLACVAVTFGLTVARMLRAEWPERPQLGLLLVAAPVAVVVVLLVEARWLGSLAFALLPVAVTVGVLRYRLLGIEVVVRRALLYGSLTGLVLLVFVAVTSALALVVPSGPVPDVVAACAVAVVLVPARDRLQRLVDRLVYGDRDDPWRALGRLGQGAAQGTGLPDVVAAVAQSLRLPGAEVRSVEGSAATWGDLGPHALDVPLVLAGNEVGTLRVSPRNGDRSLAAADLRLLEAVAPLLALVLHGSELAADLEVERERVVAATDAERARLRRDLHDGLGPSLTGIGLGLEAVDTGALSDRARGVLTRVRAEVAASLEEVRRIIDDLRPGALETDDLLTVVRVRAQQLTATSAVRVVVDAPPQLPDVPPAVEVAALRILDEALTNVVRHARATRCRVTVRLDEALHLDVEDDGTGFTIPRQGGVGLSSMHSRAVGVGGRLDVTSSEAGTRLTAELPLGTPA